jgi:uncharacterized protein (TIGR02145 family)
MKNYSHPAVRMAMCLLLPAALLFSCGQMEPFESEEIHLLSIKAVSDAKDCHSDCFVAGSQDYYKKEGSISQRSGINTKVVSYTAYNTEDSFIVEVTYQISTGPAKGRAAVTVSIGGEKKEFKDIPSGHTVSHSIALTDNWKGCEEMGFQISQTGMGKPIYVDEKYKLIPICPDGKEIEYILMGNQVWSKYNLNVDSYRNGDPIPEIQDDQAWVEAITGAWSYYRNNPANEEQFGRLYNFAAVKDPRNLAPEGWRIPTQEDWEELLEYLGTDFNEEEYKAKIREFASFIGIVPPYEQPMELTSSFRHWWSSTPHTLEGRARTYVITLDRYFGVTLHESNGRITSRLAVRLIKE